MKGSIQSLPIGSGTGQIDGADGLSYEFYAKDFSAEDMASGLEELETVSFEPVHGDVNRAMHCVRLRAVPPKVATTTTPAAEPVAVAVVEEGPPLFLPPAPAPLLCKGQLPAEWEIISVSAWCVRGDVKKHLG